MGRGISDNEAWADMTDAERWAYVSRLEEDFRNLSAQLDARIEEVVRLEGTAGESSEWEAA